MTGDPPPPRPVGYGPEPAGGTRPPATAPAPAGPRQGWTPARVVALVAGNLLLLISIGLLAAGGVAAWADHSQRDGAGYLTSSSHTFSSATYALTGERIDMGAGGDSFTPSDILGRVRLRVTPLGRRGPLFVGIASQSAVDHFLAGVDHEEVSDWASATTTYRAGDGAAPGRPAAANIWAAQSSGPGTRTLTWTPTGGHWAVVVMNADGAPGLAVTADAGARIPDLGWFAVGLLVTGVILGLAAGILVVAPVVRASR